jgi:hypothetical protein
MNEKGIGPFEVYKSRVYKGNSVTYHAHSVNRFLGENGERQRFGTRDYESLYELASDIVLASQDEEDIVIIERREPFARIHFQQGQLPVIYDRLNDAEISQLAFHISARKKRVLEVKV